MYYQEAVFEGWGDFPVDMLRYDHCWPVTQTDIGSIITQPMRFGADGKPAKYQIRVATYRKYKQGNASFFTEARWESFGWSKVSETKARKVD